MLLLVIGLTAVAQQSTRIPEPQWTSIISDSPEAFQTQLISSTENSIKSMCRFLVFTLRP